MGWRRATTPAFPLRDLFLALTGPNHGPFCFSPPSNGTDAAWPQEEFMRRAFFWTLALYAAGSLIASSGALAQPVNDPSSGAIERETPDPNAPAIQFDATSLDLGDVAKGDKAKYVFTFRNAGKSDLILEKAKPSCGCTVAEFTKTIKPGETGVVNAVVDTKRFRGPIAKTITVTCNDPVTPKVHLQAKANVKPFLDLLPSPHVFLRADRSEGASKVVTLVSYEDALDLKIEKIESSDPLITVTSKPLLAAAAVDEEGKSVEGDFELTVELSKDAPVGRINATVEIFTNSPKVPQLTMQIRGNVRGLVQVRPSRVFLGNLPAKLDEPVKKTVRVTHRKGGDLQIKGVDSSFAGIKTHVKPIEKGSFEVELTLEGELPPGTLDEHVTIHTNDADEPDITVRVRGQVGN
jgi:hypothetical protein